MLKKKKKQLRAYVMSLNHREKSKKLTKTVFSLPRKITFDGTRCWGKRVVYA